MRKQINMTKLRGLLVLFLATVPTFSHSEQTLEAVERFESVQEARKLTVEEQLAEAKSDLTLDQHTLFNLQTIDKQVFCIAQNTFFEARGESFKGKVAVSEVVVNRTESEEFPDDACGVIRQSTIVTVKEVSEDKEIEVKKKICQFSWFCMGMKTIPLRDRSGNIRPDTLREWRDSVAAAMLVYHNRIDPVAKGATHFYSTKIGTPGWARSKNLERTGAIGGHTFLRIVSR